jgi:dTDP-glucose 4,6-dehydratase
MCVKRPSERIFMMNQGHLLVTGAAGFIGSTFVRKALKQSFRVTIFDLLTYAGKMENISEILQPGKCEFVQGDITDFSALDTLFSKNDFTGLVNFAAESHVDHSITGPSKFIETNIVGTSTLLEVARKYFHAWEKKFRFLHVSTDEVFGTLGETGKFRETTAYAPNSPYSASKASSDHLVRAWHHTYGLPTIITNCSNNYGPRQFPEKLIPLTITHAVTGKTLPIYGTGENIRDWIHVEDHVAGILLALEKGRIGESYCFGGDSERSNLQVVHSICQTLDQIRPRNDGKPHADSIRFVEDRAGHDFRYAIDDKKAIKELGFKRKYPKFEEGLRQTVNWYLQRL